MTSEPLYPPEYLEYMALVHRVRRLEFALIDERAKTQELERECVRAAGRISDAYVDGLVRERDEERAENERLRANQRTGRIVHGDAEPFRCGAAYGSANRCSSQCSRCRAEYGA